MPRPVHIRGMGLVGSILARSLEREGIEFCWEDNDSSTVAWKASTGCVYPSGEATDKINYERFEDSARRLGMEYEVAEYCFSQNSIPHKEGDKALVVSRQEAGLKFVNRPSFHVNVQDFVQQTRMDMIDYRIGGSGSPYGNALTVNAHGFHQELTTDYRWGWSAEADVTLKNPQPQRICFNLKEGRFVIAYLYPKPGTGKYYIGTHFIYQKTAKQLDLKDKHTRTLAHVQAKVGEFAEIVPDWSTIQYGWRPAYTESEELVLERRGELFLKPQMANGLRHHVTFIEEVLRRIKESL